MEMEEQTIVMPVEPTPWRRFFARGLDLFIYGGLWEIFLCLVLNVNVFNRGAVFQIMNTVIALGLMLFIEPAELALFGTTIGKWILGLHITDRNGKRLFYGEAFSRTWMVIYRGYGFNIPLYDLFRLWKSYSQCKDGDTLEWEYDSKVMIRDKKKWRILLYVVVYVMLAGIFFLADLIGEMPRQRGDISAEQFCENYNRMAGVYDYDLRLTINKNGKMGEEDDGSIMVGLPEKRPDYTYTEENGVMTGMGFTQTVKDSDVWVPSYEAQMILCVRSFVGAQKDCHLFSDEVAAILNKITESPFDSFEVEAYGIRITCKVEYSGYTPDEELGVLESDQEDENSQYSLSFTMEKI